VEFDAGEGVRFAEAIKQLAKEVDTKEATELARIRKKLKLTQQQAALLTGGGPNAFSRYERGKAKPLQSVTNLFKLLDNHPELLDEIQMGGRA
jgi:HTH-type transcriptional regulator/antitoxin MqsA